jgi:hypothetical protein
MASPFDMLSGILALVNSALSPEGNPVTPYEAAVGYPSINRLQTICQNGQAAVSVYDRKISKNATRWSPYVISQTLVPATLTTEITPNQLPPGASATITLGGAVGVGDAVSAIATQLGAKTGAVVAIGLQNDTPVTMALKLWQLINSDPSMVGVVSASLNGDVVTIKNITSKGIAVGSFAGNGGTQVREIGRRDQQVQVILWAITVEQRNLMVQALAEAIAESEINFGPTLNDGSQGRLTYVSDYDLEDDTLEDTYRHDFMVACDYPVTTIDALYTVLAPVLTVEINAGDTSSSLELDFSNPANSMYLPGLT